MSRKALPLFVLLAFACSKKEAPSEPAPDPLPTKVIAEEDGSPQPENTPPEPPPLVTLVSAGSPPHRALRRQFTKGQKQTMNVNIALEAQMSVDGTTSPKTPQPPVFLDVTLSVVEIDPDGSALVGVNVTGAGVTPTEGFDQAQVAGLEEGLARAVGLEGSYRCDSRGFIRDLNIGTPADASSAVLQAISNIKQSIRQVNVELPEEAIGRGGEWKVEGRFEHAKMQVVQREVFKVKKLKPPRIVLETNLERVAGPQVITGAKGKTAQLNSLKEQAAGSGRWNLSKLAPASLDTEGKSVMDMIATGDDGAKRNLLLGTEQETAISSR